MDSMIDDNFANMDEYDGEAYDDTDIDEAVAAYADYLNTGMEAYYDDEPISVPTGLEMSNNFSTSMTTYTPDTTHICPGTCACNSSEE